MDPRGVEKITAAGIGRRGGIGSHPLDERMRKRQRPGTNGEIANQRHGDIGRNRERIAQRKRDVSARVLLMAEGRSIDRGGIRTELDTPARSGLIHADMARTTTVVGIGITQADLHRPRQENDDGDQRGSHCHAHLDRILNCLLEAHVAAQYNTDS